MAAIEARLKDVLDETRLAMLGTQLLIGIQYQAAFTPGFASLPTTFLWLHAAALMLILISAACLMATPAFHQLAEDGHATTRMLDRASDFLKWALAPLSAALAANIALSLVTSIGAVAAALAGGAFLLGATALWFVFPQYAARRKRGREEMDEKRQSLETRIAQALTEIRVILPGAQALFGFQVTAVLTEEFGRLPESSRYVHLTGVVLIAVAVVMLIAPAAYHRIATHGDAEPAMLKYAVRMMIPAEGLIAAGLIGDAYVAIRMISDSKSVALSASAAAAVGFATLLYAIPFIARGKKLRGARNTRIA